MHNKMFIFCQIIKIVYVLMKLSSFVLYSEQNDMWASIFNYHPYFPVYKTLQFLGPYLKK